MTRGMDETDIRAIYVATIDGLYRFVASHCDGDRELAEDVTQETWLRAIRAWHRGGIPDRPAAYLTTIARNILSNHYRRRRHRPPHQALDETVLATPDRTDAEERHSLVRGALSRLPSATSRLLEAFHFRRQSVAAIAAEYGLSERAVEGRLRRARQKLREQIETSAHEGDDR
jgi:RNA polymerase sigma factor (sigma-70 family)